MATCPSCRAHYPDDVATCARDGAALLVDEAFASADGELTAGTMLGEYRVEAKIGEGGFGAVYRAVHPLIGKMAAIKVLNRQYSSNPQMVSRFIAEARAVNQIRHRNIIDIFSFGSLGDGRQYYVMELLEGKTFDGYLRERGALPPSEALPILQRIGRALDAAHAAGIAHRDLKPENVFLVFDEDGGVFPKLLDFGIAKLLADSGALHKTRTGTAMGTPYYMSPEQCRGKDVDHRADVYSFGIMVHEVLTGRVPFDGEAVMDILVKQTTQAPPRMSAVNPALSPELDAPVLQMLEKDPARRPTSIGVAMEALIQAAKRAGWSASGFQATPASLAALPHGSDAHRAFAGTASSSKTLSAGALATSAPKKPRAALVVGVSMSVLAAAVGISVVTLSRKPAAAIDAELRAPAAAPPDAAATAATSTVAPSVAPAVSASASTSAEVELTIETNVSGEVDVWLGTEKLGSAPGIVKLPRGDAKLTLTLKAAGYAPVEIGVTPSASRVVSASLVRLPAAAPPRVKPGTPTDIENPF
jgi:serine/threonine-protein kinase